ncbi:TonB-dependent receptor domain-containing protein [Mucilaginibacter sp. E4BP6]|uniref:outer membrane beta-barrel family protein n=1 Tax=Mucilaginibacter sp. E4BP6 TaxID=2723089 RepID=UPI0015C78247|nr:outer membrane beta-barrel family protein [Mucilaginibacter sp. E4BP6]NYE67321.1 outer membrane receptor protein involved in Fe transport [Mucilaginibacter sp. E4BP6]
MKRFYILVLLLGSMLSAKAQFGGSTITGKISGTVIDSVTKKPVQYASVAIYLSSGKTPLNGMLTDANGGFKIYNIHPGSYKVTITFVGGYKTKTINPVVTSGSKPDANLGNIKIRPDNGDLGEVSITAKAPLIENHIDKIVYNAEKDITNVGGNASDVLQKVPLVAVDINGNVSLRGDANVKVLINGKPSGAMSASLSDVLKTIPADQIKSIEVITSPSAKYDAEGSAGIINIITKQKNASGLSGSVSGGIGTRQNNGNFNLNYNKNRFSISANIGGNLTWPQTSITKFSQTITSDTSRNSLQSTRNSTIKRYGTISSLTAGYDINSYNSLTSTFRYNRGGFNQTGPSTTSSSSVIHGTTVDTSFASEYQNNTIQHNLFYGFDWSLDYTHKFRKEGEELDLSAQWSHSAVNTDYTNTYAGESPYANQRGLNDGTNNEYTFQLDYTLPISKLLKFEAGGKTTIRRLNSNFDTFGGDNLDVLDAANSDLYDYNQNVYAGYSVFTFTLPKNYTILAGGRFENTTINGDAISAEPNLPPVDQNYNIFIPSLTIQKQFGTSQTLKLSYSKRITRPSLTYLNPFVNMSNPQSESAGNPNLSPEISQTIELNYNTFIKSSVINFSVYYKHINGLIESILTPTTVNDSTKGTLSTYQNIGSNNSWGSSFFGSINPIKILTIRGSINAYTYNPDPTGAFAQDHSAEGTYIQYNAFGMAEVDLKSIVGQVFAIENSPRRTIQGTNPSFSLLGFGVRKQFDNKKASIGVNVLQPFNKYKYFDQNISSPGLVQTSSTAFPFRSVGLTFSYSFGKITFSNPKTKSDNPDEEKQDDQGGPGGAPAAGGSSK